MANARTFGQFLSDFKDKMNSDEQVAKETKETLQRVSDRLSSKLGSMIDVLESGGELSKQQQIVLRDQLGITEINQENIKSFLDDQSKSIEDNINYLEEISKTLTNGGVLSETQTELLKDIVTDTETKEDRLEARTREERRDDQYKEMVERLEGIQGGISTMEDKIGSNAGKVGILAALGLLVFDPKTLQNAFNSFIEYINDISALVSKIASGDWEWEDVLNTMKDNLGWVGVTIGVLAVKFAVISSVFGFIAKGVAKIWGPIKGIWKAVKFSGKLIGNLGKMFLKIGRALGFTGALVALAAKSVWDMFAKWNELRANGAGVVEALGDAAKELVATLIGLPLDLVKDLVSWFAGILGFESFKNYLDSFSFEDGINELIDEASFALTDWVWNMSTKLGEWWQAAMDFLPSWEETKTALLNTFNNVKEAVKQWFKDAWNFLSDPAEALTTLKNIFTGVFDSVKQWFKDTFDFLPSWEQSKEVLSKVFDETIDSIKNFFKKIFDFLPSWEEIKGTLASLKPDWLMSDAEKAAAYKQRIAMGEYDTEQFLKYSGADTSAIQKDLEARGILDKGLAGDTLKTDIKGLTQAEIATILEQNDKIGGLPAETIKALKAEFQSRKSLGAASDNLSSMLTADIRTDQGRATQAMDYFMSRGWTKEQAAGLVGNLQAESGMNLDERAVGDGGKAYGIAQWHPDRQANFEKQFGKPITEATFEEQLAFVDWELNNTEKPAGNKLRSANTAAGAAYVVDKNYERSKGLHTDKRMNLAGQLARDYTMSIPASIAMESAASEPELVVTPTDGKPLSAGLQQASSENIQAQQTEKLTQRTAQLQGTKMAASILSGQKGSSSKSAPSISNTVLGQIFFADDSVQSQTVKAAY